MSRISETATDFLDRTRERFSKRDAAMVEKALQVATEAHATQKRGTGEPYVTHSITVAYVLLSWNLDAKTVTAALLHDVPEDTDVPLEDIRTQFGPEVSHLVESVTKLSTVRVPKHPTAYESENLRRLFLAMAEDVRVVLLKLADRLHNMRTLKGVPPHKRQRIARETLEIYAPLADRLGMGEVRSELDDLGFRYADPKEYEWTKRQVQQTHSKRERYIAKVKRELAQVLEEAGIRPTINARTKNLHSLYQKLLQRERDIDKIYDLFAVRVIVDSIEDCYQGMGVIHRRWQPLPHRIKDYIAVPKQNGYRSLHTTIFGPDNRLLEVQLRTPEMHEEAELGIAAHAVYAEGKRSVKAKSDQLAVMRQLASWQDEIAAAPEFVDRFKLDLFSKRVFAFTPKGSVHSLPAGSTPVDFAYAVHTEVGNTCTGAKVNGVLVSLDTELANGDVVEIVTSKSGTPKQGWLRFVRTGGARSNIRAHFRKQKRADNLKAGREMMETILGEHGLTVAGLGKPETAALAELPPQGKGLDDVLVALGEGRLTQSQILRALGLEAPTPTPRRQKPRPVERTLAISLSGLDTLATNPAKCCKPKAGDAIVGYITLGRGISIHRRDCKQVPKLPDPTRVVPVTWKSR